MKSSLFTPLPPQHGYRRTIHSDGELQPRVGGSVPLAPHETGTQFRRQADMHSACALTASSISAVGIE